VGSLSLAFDRVMIRSLTGTINSPLTMVWAIRGSLRVKSFDKAITLERVNKKELWREGGRHTFVESHHNLQN